MPMNPDDVTKFKSLYLQTAWGYLNMLNKSIAFLLKGEQTKEAVESAHLAAHSLKSQSLLMGYVQIGTMQGEMEKIFNDCKEKLTVPDNTTMDIILSGLKKIQTSLLQISDSGKEMDMSDEIKKLEATTVNKQ